MLAAAILVVGSALILALSWRSLRRPRSHGFFRFFAIESLLFLVVVNAGVWFAQPFAPRQVVSWLLLAASAGLAFHGFHLLHVVGRPRAAGPGEAANAANLPFENTTTLVTCGAYCYIRHPLYASLLLLVWGAALKRLSPASVALGAAATLFVVATAKADERECVERFGEAYRDYIARTRMFIPFLI
jgi:protein-S-isoprenylcysteine O-methyltransferase Ste14